MNDLIKISDYIIRELYDNDIDTIFGVTGGAAVHFFDSANRHPDMSTVFFNHEQSASFAAESYAKVRNGLGAGIFTTGPGATNALTGLTAAWLDSIPTIYISGQVRADQVIGTRKVRQIGTQEVDIISMVKSVTKYAVTIKDIREVKYHLTKAIFLSKHGRPGPVWVDIPVDISWSSIEESKLIKFDSNNEFPKQDKEITYVKSNTLQEITKSLFTAKRPLILVGYGTRLSGAENSLISFIEKHKIPIVTSWNICDIVESEHQLNLGRPGIAGQRGANLAIQNCDFLLCLGSHLNSSITGTLYDAFAREAKVVVVDIDINELDNLSIHTNWKINSDIGKFISQLDNYIEDNIKTESINIWHNLYIKYQGLNNFAKQLKDQEEYVNSYFFQDLVSEKTTKNDIYVVDGGGTVVYSSFQSCLIKKGQRLILSTSLCSMGSGIPESIGVACASKGKRVICFVGDGSFPFNMQELQLIKDHNISILIFVLNNNGYVSIRTTQADFLDSNFVGSNSESGLSLPKVKSVANSFGIEYSMLSNHAEVIDQVDSILDKRGPLICEVMISPSQEIVPRQGFVKNNDNSFSPRPLEDMYPFLDRDLYKSLMVVGEWKINNSANLGCEIDLLKNYPKTTRLVEERDARRKLSSHQYISIKNNDDKIFEQLLLKKAREFGDIYFDGDRLYGYGGYYYDQKYWYKVAADIIEFYKLNSDANILDIGCAKGFLLHDLKSQLPKLNVFGIDISEYAVNLAMPSIADSIQVGDITKLPFEDNYFDLVISINTLSELDDIGCRGGIREIERVSKKNSFIIVNAWSNNIERDNLMKWNLTALSNHSKNEWKNIFNEEKYSGDYYWFTP
jgi:acetolactate synthase I/II/III large subunit